MRSFLVLVLSVIGSAWAAEEPTDVLCKVQSADYENFHEDSKRSTMDRIVIRLEACHGTFNGKSHERFAVIPVQFALNDHLAIVMNIAQQAMLQNVQVRLTSSTTIPKVDMWNLDYTKFTFGLAPKSNFSDPQSKN